MSTGPSRRPRQGSAKSGSSAAAKDPKAARAARAKARRQAQQRQRLMMIAAAIVIVILLIVLIRGRGKNTTQASSEVTVTDQGSIVPLTPVQELEATGEYYPDCLYELVKANSETLEFALQYPTLGNEEQTIDLSAEAQSDTVPLLIQWDTRWGYHELGDGMIANNGCAPTSLTMVVLYLTHDASVNPIVIADYAVEEGYYLAGSGSQWSLLQEGCQHYGLVSKECMKTEEDMKAALDAGHPIIANMGPGDFTTLGHYLVIAGYDDDGFIINDPFSKVRSAQRWTFERLEDQIKVMWSFSVA